MFGIDAKALIALFKDNPSWIVLLTIFLFALGVWGKLNWEALNGREKKPESFDWAIKQLKENNWGTLYLSSLGWVLDKISGWIGDRDKLDQIYETPENPKGLVQKFFGFNPFTPESYEKCLRLAFLYPVLSYFICWVMGGNGQVGGVDLLGKEATSLEIWQRLLLIAGLSAVLSISFWLLFSWDGWRRWLELFLISLVLSTISVFSEESFARIWFAMWFFFLFFFLPIYAGGWLTGWIVYRSRKTAHESIFFFAFAFVGALAGADAFADVFAFAFAVTVAGAFAGAVAFAFAGVGPGPGAGDVAGAFAAAFAAAVAGVVAVTGVVAGVVAGAIFVLFGAAQKWSDDKDKTASFWLSYSVLFLVLGYVSLHYVNTSGYAVLLLFWLVLPLVNATLDWLSLGVTRGLLQAVRAGHHGAGFALAWGLLDLLFALGFLFLITAVLVLATALGNVIAGETLVDLQVIFTELRADRSSVNYWWVYFMLLSTLVPTLVHFALAGGAATLWLPRALRVRIARNLELNHFKISAAWFYLTFTPAIGFVFAPALLLGSLYWLVSHGGWFGGQLLDWAEWLAMAVNPKIEAQP